MSGGREGGNKEREAGEERARSGREMRNANYFNLTMR